MNDNELLDALESTTLPNDEPETGTQVDEIPTIWGRGDIEKGIELFNNFNTVKTKLIDTKTMVMRQFNEAFDFWHVALAAIVESASDLKDDLREQAELSYATTGEKKIVDPVLTVTEVKTVDFGNQDEKHAKENAILSILEASRWYQTAEGEWKRSQSWLLDQIGIDLALNLDMRRYPKFLELMDKAPDPIRAELCGIVKIVGQAKFSESKLPDLDPVPVTPTEEYMLYQAALEFAKSLRPAWLDEYDPMVEIPDVVKPHELPKDHPDYFPF